MWAIGSPGYKSETEESLRDFREAFGLTFPILLDPDGQVMEMYGQEAFGISPYPQDWVIGSDGRVAYVNTAYEPDEMKAILDKDLAN